MTCHHPVTDTGSQGWSHVGTSQELDGEGGRCNGTAGQASPGPLWSFLQSPRCGYPVCLLWRRAAGSTSEWVWLTLKGSRIELAWPLPVCSPGKDSWPLCPGLQDTHHHTGLRLLSSSHPTKGQLVHIPASKPRVPFSVSTKAPTSRWRAGPALTQPG